jgi:multidrug efflux pump subunit AcrA (membrane-fusion protein)
MKRGYWVLIAIGIMIAILTGGCGSAAPTAAAPTQPAATASTAQPAGTVSASAQVEPVQKSSMAFVIAGPAAEVDVKAGEQVKAGQKLVALDMPDLSYAVVSAQAELKSAQANATLQHMARKVWNPDKLKFMYLSGPPELRQIADARVVQAQAALDLAQANLAEATLVAPYDGTVVSINLVAGEMAATQQPVLVIADLSHLEITTTDLSEREIAGVQVGQSATTRLKAFDQDLTGKVVAIDPMSAQHNGDTVFKVTIDLDHVPMGLMWGMSGDVSIRVGK